MIQKVLTVFVALACVVTAVSCGGSSNEKAVCDALVNSLYTACDPTDPADQAILIAAFAALGETVTVEELESMSEGAAVDECTTSFEEGGVTITDDDRAIAVAAIEAVPTTDCETTVTALTAMLSQLE